MPAPDGAADPAASERSGRGQSAPAEAQESAEAQDEGLVSRIAGAFAGVKNGLMAWLYDGVQTTGAQQMTGSLVQVEIGLQNDDYAEILSGVSEGDVVLYTSSDTSSSSMNMMFGGAGGGNRGGNMGGGMGGAPMGF